MVEVDEKNILECLKNITLKIRCNNLENDLKKVEHKSMFKSLSHLDKISFVLEYADLEILKAHEELEETKKLAKITYSKWKEIMVHKFGVKYTKREFLREFQNNDESCSDFFKRIKELGKKITTDPEWSFEVAYKGMRRNIERFQFALIGISEIDDNCLNIISQTDKIISEAKKRNFKSSNKSARISVNYVSEIDKNIKENSIYFQNFRFSLIVDTGSSFNFVTEKIINRLKVKTLALERPLKLYTCLLTPFFIKEKVKLKFKLSEKFYEDWFYIMPKRDDESVILGNEWLRGNTEIVGSNQKFKSCSEAIKFLCMENQNGIKDYFCSIKTKDDEKVVDVVYKIPQALELKVEKEVKRLLKKNSTRISNLFWLNNVRPVQKDDGCIRLTTNN